MPPVAPPASASATRLAGLSLGVLRNPRSGANLRAAAAMQRVLAAHPAIPCRDVQDPPSVAQALREMAERGVDIIAISGGDGTVHAVLDTVFGASPVSAPALARRTARRHRQHDGARRRHARSPGSRAGLADRTRRARRRRAGRDRARRHAHRPRRRAGADPRHVLRRGGDRAGHRLLQAQRAHAGPARRDRTRRSPWRASSSRWRAASARSWRRSRSRWRSTATRPRPSTARSCTSPRWKSWCWGCVPIGAKEAGPLHYASVRAAPKHWIRALPGLLRGRPNRFVTPANGYESRNAHRLAIRLDSPFFVDGEIFSPTPGVPLTFESGGTARFVTLR